MYNLSIFYKYMTTYPIITFPKIKKSKTMKEKVIYFLAKKIFLKENKNYFLQVKFLSCKIVKISKKKKKKKLKRINIYIQERKIFPFLLYASLIPQKTKEDFTFYL